MRFWPILTEALGRRLGLLVFLAENDSSPTPVDGWVIWRKGILGQKCTLVGGWRYVKEQKWPERIYRRELEVTESENDPK